jgi:1-acyl-sn-glycerol-3-phosphate acyltransferase
LEANKSYIFISNHRSYLDTAVMFRYTSKRVGVIAKKELLKLPVAGYLMKNIDILTIDRSNPQKSVETMQNATNIIKKGVSLGIYPEGTRALPHELLPFKKGAFHLALQTGAEIVPMVMKNSDLLFGKRTGYAQPGTLKVVFLKPIETTDYNEESLEKLRDEVRMRIAEELSKG